MAEETDLFYAIRDISSVPMEKEHHGFLGTRNKPAMNGDALLVSEIDILVFHASIRGEGPKLPFGKEDEGSLEGFGD